MTSRRHLFGLPVLVLAMLASAGVPARENPPGKPLTIFAAASLREALDAINAAWTTTGHPPARIAYAGSGTLARQIEQGAPADIFIPADETWMDALAAHGAIAPGTRRIIAGNRLVVIAAADSGRRVTPEAGMPAGTLLVGGKLAIGDEKAVPAGAYARAALETLGVWPALQAHLIRVENVRVALALVARGEVETGIVYATDAAAEPRVAVIGVFPVESHPPIRYRAARVSATLRPDAQNPDTDAFLAFLGSEVARGVFARLGFKPGG